MKSNSAIIQSSHNPSSSEFAKEAPFYILCNKSSTVLPSEKESYKSMYAGMLHQTQEIKF